MAIILNRTTTFATNGTVTAAGLHNLIDDTAIYSGLITTQTNLASVGTGDKLLIAQAAGGDTSSPFSTTVLNLFDDALTGGTYTNLNLSESLTYGTATGNRTISTSATITTGTIPNLTSSTANITLGTIPTLTAGTTTSTAQIATSGTIATLNSTTGTIATLNSTTGTIATLKSTTGTITNLSTTLAGDFTISQGTGTLGTSGVVAGTYGTNTSSVRLDIDSKGRITTISTSLITATPADASITAPKLSGAQTGSAPIYAVRAWVLYDQVASSVTSSANVSSVADSSTGVFFVNFTTAMPSANYTISGSGLRNVSSGLNALIVAPNLFTARTTGSCRIMTDNTANTKENCPSASVVFMV